MGTLALYDKALPATEAKGLPSTRALVVAADDNQVYVQVFRVPNGDGDVTLLLTPAAARDLANALSAAAGYVERSPTEGTQPRYESET